MNLSSLDYNPIFENDFFTESSEITPEDFDNINEFLQKDREIDLITESRIERFSNRKGE